jgi:hypothetical protein
MDNICFFCPHVQEVECQEKVYDFFFQKYIPTSSLHCQSNHETGIYYSSLRSEYVLGGATMHFIQIFTTTNRTPHKLGRKILHNKQQIRLCTFNYTV